MKRVKQRVNENECWLSKPRIIHYKALSYAYLTQNLRPPH
jgi:hypothetical protein